MQTPYNRIGRFYDALYVAKGRDPAAEISYLARYWVDDGCLTDQRTILDAACGTGVHLGELATHGCVEGLDRSLDMLAVARKNHPNRPFHVGDLETFQLHRQFNVVTCLFGGAGYLPSRAALRRALATLGAHVTAGGVLLIEPPLFREYCEAPQPQRIETSFEAGVLIRETEARCDGDFLEMDFDWRQLDAGGEVVDQVRERHRLLLLHSSEWKEELCSALPAGTRIDVDSNGPGGRGLLVARFSPSGVLGIG